MRPRFILSWGVGAIVAAGAALPSEAFAETMIPSGTLGAVTWTAEGSPYLVQGDITVASLTVQSGTVVRAVGTQQIFFFVNGPLTVTGSSAQPVVFEGDGAEGRWGTIQAQSASIAHATLKDAQQLQLTSASAPSVIQECTFDKVLVHPLGNLEVDRSLFLVGSAGVLVGSSATAVTTVTNSVFHSQSSSGAGYGMDVSGKATITNSTFDGFQAGLYVNSNNVVVRNSIFTNSTRVATSGVPTVSYSLFWNVTQEGPTSEPLEGAGIVRADPKYASATDFRLLPDSPAIDSGTSAGAPDHDFSGQPRPQGKGVDMGAYELVAMAGMGGMGGASGSGGSAGGGAGNAGGAGGSASGEGGESNGGEPGDTGGTGESGGTAGERDGGLGGGSSPQGGSMTGGVAGTDTAGGVGGSGRVGKRSRTIETSGCGCRQSRSGSAGSLAALVVAAMLWARGRRRV